MTPSGNLPQRIQTFVKTTVYKIVLPPTRATVVEREKAGEALVECTIREGSLCIEWSLPTGLFNFLLEDKNADGAFFLGHEGSLEVEAHIIECKRTVDQKKWIDVTRQMRWTLSKLRALAGALGLSISRVVLYTAFRTDDLSTSELSNPGTLGRTLGPSSEEDEAEAGSNEYRRMILAWEEDKVRLTGFEGIFQHKKIQLDKDTGKGAVAFDCA